MRIILNFKFWLFLRRVCGGLNLYSFDGILWLWLEFIWVVFFFLVNGEVFFDKGYL